MTKILSAVSQFARETLTEFPIGRLPEEAGFANDLGTGTVI